MRSVNGFVNGGLAGCLGRRICHGCPGGPGLRPGRGGELPEVGSAGRRGAGRPAWRALTSDGALRRGMPGDACSGDRRQRQGACALQLARQADVAGPCGRLGPETPAGGRREQAPPRRGVLPGDGGQDGRLESARERPGAAATGLSASASASGAGPAAVTEGECPPDTVAMRRAQIADYGRTSSRVRMRRLEHRTPRSGITPWLWILSGVAMVSAPGRSRLILADPCHARGTRDRAPQERFGMFMISNSCPCRAVAPFPAGERAPRLPNWPGARAGGRRGRC
jgi:hypothetical protein